jgi:hypothetical protein
MVVRQCYLDGNHRKAIELILASFDRALSFKLHARQCPTAFHAPTLYVNGPDDGIKLLSTHYTTRDYSQISVQDPDPKTVVQQESLHVAGPVFQQTPCLV